jgi:glutamine amidotransferase
MKSICIIDYGMGNIKSLTNAIKKIGYRPRLLSEEDEINTNFAIIPGVGAFNSAMSGALVVLPEVSDFAVSPSAGLVAPLGLVPAAGA